MKAIYFQHDKEPVELDVLSLNEDQTANLGRDGKVLVGNVPIVETPKKPGSAVLIESSGESPPVRSEKSESSKAPEPPAQAQLADEEILNLMNHDDEDEEPQIDDKKRKKA